MARPPRLSFADLMETARSFPPEVRADQARLTFTMATGPIEATFAEFDFARFLYIHGIAFKFVTPVGVKGKDYDFGIEYSDAREACGEAKCRLEGTEVRTETIRNSLEKARANNLLSDKPGIVFVKVPQTWFEQGEVQSGIRIVVEGFLRSTERIVLVVVYTTAEFAEQEMTLHRHRFLEFANESHRFDQTKNWALFKGFKVPEEWGGMPPWWLRVFSQGFIMRDK